MLKLSTNQAVKGNTRQS